MNNLFKRYLSLRKGFITGVILLIIINILIIFGYYNLFLSNKIMEKYQTFTNELEEKMQDIENEIKDVENPNEYFKEIVDKDNISISIYNSNNELVNEYSNFTGKSNINISKIIMYNDQPYLVNISERRNALNFRIAIDFLIFEIVNICFLALLGITLSNIKLLGPITSLSKDFNNYKLGIIPKKRKIKGEIDSLQNDFVDLVNDLEEQQKNQNRIIASISHDIKTPLTSILGYSERIITTNLPEKTKEKYATTIYNKALSLKEIVEEFDDYLSCNIKDEKKTEKISIKYIVDYLKKYYKDDLKEKEIELKIKTNCPNSIIEVDLAKFKRIFSNVITNSIRHYTSAKKILNIYINEQKDGTIIFKIADNGSGCEEDLEKIFEPLYTTDKSRKISGLGLSICKEIVESHNGKIKAINNKLGGFSIIFTIKKYEEE